MPIAKDDEARAWKEMAAKLRQARKESGLSQAEVAEKTGISRVAISEIESARRKVSSLELAALARTFALEPDHFLGGAVGEEAYGAPATISHLARTARQLAPEDQEQLVRFAEYLKHQAQQRPEGA